MPIRKAYTQEVDDSIVLRDHKLKKRDVQGASGRQSGGRGPGSRTVTPGGFRRHVREWIKSLVVAAVLFILVRSFLIQTVVVTSGSMEQTLLVGDMLLVNRAALGSRIGVLGLQIPGYSEPHRRDLIVFDPPPPDTVGMRLVKRLVGIPGDTIWMENQNLYINGERQDEPYVRHTGVPDDAHPWIQWQRKYLLEGVDSAVYSPTRDTWGPLVIPEDSYFMMGDNRDESFDSRYWGIVERWRFEGRPTFTYFSYNRGSYRPFPWLMEIRWGRIGPTD